MTTDEQEALLAEMRAFRDGAQKDGRVDMAVGANHCMAIVQNWFESHPGRTSETPKVPGWYLRFHPSLPLGRELVMISKSPSGNDMGILFRTDGTDHYLHDVAGEWAGPLMEQN